MEVLVYTAIIGGCDTLKKAPSGVRCVCFTDSLGLPREAGWEIRLLSMSTESPRLQSRRLRCQPDLLFPAADVFVWLDASCEFRGFSELLVDAKDMEMAALAHPDRHNCKAESETCVKMGYRPRSVHDAQMAEFRAAGYAFRGLTAGHMTWRKNTARVAKFGEAWWDQILRYGARDQCSVDYCAWSVGLNITHLTGTYRRNPYFWYDLKDHRRRRHGGA